ncbi:hypothetical protein Glove_33g217 [Diversispora epigaea]|uniref:Uncharacterized protein n=1 Tax=Diversispora epigaea TaxID=1348612 RepID=A0A397JRW9_9GLOM|nr:hypothetical protein Glove_33g217 [Diversispora epigaea]
MSFSNISSPLIGNQQQEIIPINSSKRSKNFLESTNPYQESENAMLMECL